MSAGGRQGRRNRAALGLIFAVTGGAWAWTLQLWLSWILAEPLCFLQPGEFRLAGLGSDALWLGIGVATGLLALAALVTSYRLWRSSARVSGGPEGAEQAGDDGPRRFLAYSGLVLNTLFLLTIVLGATSPIWLPACV